MRMQPRLDFIIDRSHRPKPDKAFVTACVVVVVGFVALAATVAGITVAFIL